MEGLELTADQAAAVRGDDGFSRLEPRQMLDGKYFLPGTVLDDPAFAEQHAELAALPRRVVTLADFAQGDE